MGTWRRWAPEEDERLRVLRAEGLSNEVIGLAMNRTTLSVRSRCKYLRLSRTKEPRWTAQEEHRLVEMVEQHHSFSAIGRTLNRSVGAVRIRAVRLNVSHLFAGIGKPINSMALVLGVDSKTVTWWVNRGYLKAHDAGTERRSRGRQRIIEWDDLEAFLENEEHWCLWEPERIKDAGLRAWTREMRAGITFLTIGQAAERLCVTHFTVNRAIREGRLRGYRGKPNWMVRSDHCIMWDRKTPAPRQYATIEDMAFIERWWSLQPATWIARRINKTPMLVSLTATRMGLSGVGRGYWKQRQAQQATLL